MRFHENVASGFANIHDYMLERIIYKHMHADVRINYRYHDAA